jgi:hypothetical protein
MVSERTPRAYGVMPNFDAHLKNFAGVEGELEAENWLNALNGLADVHEWPDKFKLEAAKMRLVGAAKFWLAGRLFKNWSEFEAEFCATFTRQQSCVEKWKAAIGRIQIKSEKTAVYFHEKSYLCRSVGMKLNDFKSLLVEGLWSQDLAYHLLARQHASENEIFSDLISFEAISENRSGRVQETGRFGASNSRDGTEQITTTPKEPQENWRSRNTKSVRCYNCGEDGHVSTGCPERKDRNTCYRCKETGHFQADCPTNIKKAEILATTSGEVTCMMVEVEKDGYKKEDTMADDVGVDGAVLTEGEKRRKHHEKKTDKEDPSIRLGEKCSRKKTGKYQISVRLSNGVAERANLTVPPPESFNRMVKALKKPPREGEELERAYAVFGAPSNCFDAKGVGNEVSDFRGENEKGRTATRVRPWRII